MDNGLAFYSRGEKQAAGLQDTSKPVAANQYDSNFVSRASDQAT